MKSHTFIKVKRPIKYTTSQTSFSDLTPEELVKPGSKVEIEQQEELVKPGSKVEIEQQEELEPMVVTDAFLEAPRDESVYGCGWSLTELLNEFNSR